jgi:hypothetical protein
LELEAEFSNFSNELFKGGHGLWLVLGGKGVFVKK